VSAISDFTFSKRAVDIAEDLTRAWDKFGAVGKAPSGFAPYYGQILATPPQGGFKEILEIGVLGGGGHRAWSSVFPDANVWGFDIDSSTVIEEKKIKTFVADQLSEESLKRVSGLLPDTLDLIVDDGWHQPEAGLKSLKHFLPRLSAGGYYVIEDVDWAKYRKVWFRVQVALSHGYFTSFIPLNTDASARAVKGTYGLFIIQRK
jgi:hypothetical protein